MKLYVPDHQEMHHVCVAYVVLSPLKIHPTS